jgi:hypothetical protein
LLLHNNSNNNNQQIISVKAEFIIVSMSLAENEGATTAQSSQ